MTLMVFFQALYLCILMWMFGNTVALLTQRGYEWGQNLLNRAGELVDMHHTSSLTFIILHNQIAAQSKCSDGMLINQLYQNKLAPEVKLKREHSMLQRTKSNTCLVNPRPHRYAVSFS